MALVSTPPAHPLRVRLAAGARSDILAAHAEATQVEACGLLVGVTRRKGSLLHVEGAIVVPNAHPTPRTRWAMTPESQLEASRAARAAGLEVLGTWHGHVLGPPEPSQADVEGHVEFEATARGRRVLVIVGRGAGTRPVIRAWRPEGGIVREIPIRG